MLTSKKRIENEIITVKIYPMKKVVFFAIIFYCITQTSIAQVGVGNTNPQAMLDVSSSDSGILIPRVTLTRIDLASPITSPSDSELVFNDTTTPISSSIPKHLRVTKGFYYWNVTSAEWVHIADDVQIPSFNASFTQTTQLAITGSSFANIPGMSNTFTAPYDGTYQVVFTGGYGVGNVTSTSHKYEVGIGEATFRLKVDTMDTDRVVGSRSYYFKTGTTQHSNLIQWVTIYDNVTLVAGQTCTVNAQIKEISKDNLASNSIVGKNSGAVSDPKYRSQMQIALISN